MVLITWLCLRSNGICVKFPPLVQVVIEGNSHGVSLTNLVVTNGGNSILVDEAVSAIHTFKQMRWMMAPVEQVDA